MRHLYHIFLAARVDSSVLARGCAWLTLVAMLCTTGCGWVQSRVTGGLMEDVALATSRHDDVALVRQAIPPFLLLMDGLIEGSPTNVRLLTDAAQSYTSYAALLEVEEPDRAALLYGRARAYGRRALIAKHAAVGPLLKQPYDAFTQVSDVLTPEDVEIVFWAASSWGAWISAHLDSMAAIAQLPHVIFLMEWVLQQDEAFLDGAPHVFLGVYHAALPRLMGGAPERSRAHFDRALEIGQRQSLMVQVQMARYYARQIFDRDLFVALLEEVIQTPADINQDLTLQNMAAKEQARALLEQADELF